MLKGSLGKLYHEAKGRAQRVQTGKADTSVFNRDISVSKLPVLHT